MPTTPAARSRIAVEDVGGVAVVTFTERRIPDEETAQAGDDLFRLVDELGRRRVLLDLEGLEFMSSAALGKLIALYHKLRAAQGTLVLCRVPRNVMEVFRVTRLERLFTIIDRPDLATTADIVREGFGGA